MNDIPKVEDLLRLSNFLNDIDIVDGELIGELARRRIRKTDKIVKLLHETFLRKSTNLCKSFVGSDVSRLDSYSICQPMLTGLYTRWEYGSENQCFTTRQNKLSYFENMVLSFFQRIQPDCRLEIDVTTGLQQKIDCFSVDGVGNHCNTVFETKGCCYHYRPSQEARSSLSLVDSDFERGVKKREEDEMRTDYVRQKRFQIIEMWECVRVVESL